MIKEAPKPKPQRVLDGLIATVGVFLVALGAEKNKPMCTIREYYEFLNKFNRL